MTTYAQISLMSQWLDGTKPAYAQISQMSQWLGGTKPAYARISWISWILFLRLPGFPHGVWEISKKSEKSKISEHMQVLRHLASDTSELSEHMQVW